MSCWIQQTLNYWQSGGFLLLPIALVCLGIWGLFLRSRNMLSEIIREGKIVRHALHHDISCKTTESLFIKLDSLHGGIAEMVKTATQDVICGGAPREALETHESECMNFLKRDLVILAALTAIAPLLGLLGTVVGMIQTFDAVATVGGNTGIRVADGISQALITTQFGLVVAVPGIFSIARLKRMLRNTQVVMAECRSHVLQTLEQGI